MVDSRYADPVDIGAMTAQAREALKEGRKRAKSAKKVYEPGEGITEIAEDVPLGTLTDEQKAQFQKK